MDGLFYTKDEVRVCYSRDGRHCFFSLKFCLTYMAGPVLTSFQLPFTSVLHTAKRIVFSRNVYLLIVEVCTYCAQQFKHEEFGNRRIGGSRYLSVL